MKRRIAITVAVIMCIGMMTGCGKTAQVEQATADQADDQTLQEADDFEDAPDIISNLEDGTVNRKNSDSPKSAGVTKSAKSGGGSKLCYSGKDVNGKQVNTADIFAQNKVTLVNLWASWCGPCAGEIPELDEINGELQKKGCGVMGILTDGEDPDGLNDALDILDDAGATYTNVICSESLLEELGIEAFPTTFFVDSSGNILGEPVIGAYPDQYRETIDKLLSDM